MEKKMRKLQLNKKTLRKLEDRKLAGLAGAVCVSENCTETDFCTSGCTSGTNCCSSCTRQCSVCCP